MNCAAFFQNGMEDDPHSTNVMTTNNAISDPTIAKPNEAACIQKYFFLNKKTWEQSRKKSGRKNIFLPALFFYILYFLYRHHKNS